MAFCGQHAAAQLEQLDHSPLFRRYTFPLSLEVAGYLGNVTPLMPPAVLHWSRVLGRVASMEVEEVIHVHTDEIDGLDCFVRVLYPMVYNGRWTMGSDGGTPDELFRRRENMFLAQISTPYTFEDIVFYASWCADNNGVGWPEVRSGDYHPSLMRLAPQHRMRMHDLAEEVSLYHRINRQRNLVYTESESSGESDSDFDEEL